jgi:hypothetical protein
MINYIIDFPNYDSIRYISYNGDVLKTIDYDNSWFLFDINDNMDITIRWYAIQYVNKNTDYIAYLYCGTGFVRTINDGILR